MLKTIDTFKHEPIYIGNCSLVDIATMLRQQALEIQALHQIIGYEGVAVGQDYLDDCVADLRKAQEK